MKQTCLWASCAIQVLLYVALRKNNGQNLHTNSAQLPSKEVMCFLLLWELLNITSTLHVQLLPERFSLLQDVVFYGSKLVTKYSNGYAMCANFVFSHSVPLHMGRGRILLDFCSAKMEHGMFSLPLHAIKKWLCQKQVTLCQFSSEETSNSKTAPSGKLLHESWGYL